MSDDRAVTVEHVRKVILPHLGPAVQWHVEDRVIKGRDSWIFKAHGPHAPFPLALKVYCTAVEPKETVRQARLLRRYHAAMAGKADGAVPAPFVALPDHRTLVMEWIDDPGLDTLLRRAGRRPEERSRLIAAAGRWLRHFHDQSHPATQPLQLDRMQPRIDLLLGGEPGAGHKVADPTFRSAYRQLLRGIAEFAGAPHPHAMAHGDFIAKNLLHGGRGTTGIDIGGRANFPVTFDVFRFLVEVDVERPVLSQASLGIKGPDAQAFLAGYGVMHPPDARGVMRPPDACGVMQPLNDDRLMTFLYLAATMSRWAHRISLIRQRRYRLFRFRQALRLRRMARHAVAVLEHGGTGARSR